uniref:Uncharacterized protein n=1 Tax=Setaria viridis TaxID=4556 RepID=A0A4U6WFE0_SETVI|nr:hypothetical protein SEVIR_1G311950v2 [Setaria viridis]
MAAILWRKKLVLHRSLAGVSIGISQNPIIPSQFRASKGIPSASRRRAKTRRRQTLAGRRSHRAPKRDNSATLRRPEEAGGRRSSKKENPFLLVFLYSRFLSIDDERALIFANIFSFGGHWNKSLKKWRGGFL